MTDFLRIESGVQARLVDGEVVDVLIDLNRAHVSPENGLQLQPSAVRNVPGYDMVTQPPTLVLDVAALRRIVETIGPSTLATERLP